MKSVVVVQQVSAHEQPDLSHPSAPPLFPEYNLLRIWTSSVRGIVGIVWSQKLGFEVVERWEAVKRCSGSGVL